MGKMGDFVTPIIAPSNAPAPRAGDNIVEPPDFGDDYELPVELNDGESVKSSGYFKIIVSKGALWIAQLKREKRPINNL